uniref:hypothetical protein n=1 Tax=Anaerosporobacter sp. TaxID=1872529 RepID=UPI00286ECD70
MVSVFYWVLNMTIVGSIFALILLGIRRIKRLPRMFVYAMYSLLFVRLLCPFGLTSGFSLLNILPRGSVNLVYLERGSSSASIPELSYSNVMQSANSYFPMVLKSDRIARFYEVGSIVWIVILAALLVGYSLLYIMSINKIRKSIYKNGDFYQSHAIDVPM